MLLRPRSGLIAPVPVEAHEHFTATEIERARRYRNPQLALLAATAATEAGVLVAALRRPGALPRRAPAAGAAVSLALTAATLPLGAAMRKRSIDVGLATQSWRGWAADVGKGTAIGTAMSAVGAGAAAELERRFGRRWWLPGAGIAATAGTAMLWLGPAVLDPVFNTFTPLPDGPLRSSVVELAARAEVRVGEVYEVDASRRTTASNAYVTGLGPTKRVVLFDTLIGDFAPEETRLVVAHELAHVRHRDVQRNLLALALVAPPALRAVALLAERWSAGDERRRIPALALALGVVTTPVSLVANQLSRRVEVRADSYALGLTGAVEPFVRFQAQITVKNLSDPDPPAWLHRLLGTHPTAVERIGIAKAYAAGTKGR
ncbi:MAG: endopeptidase [Solirubrobacteraceae bacterium]|nr:endopeptidase [Solirubrobacteraceae bacterium]